MSGVISGIGDAVSSVFGGGSSSGKSTGPGVAVQPYQPQNQQQFDQYYNQLIQQMMGNNTAAQLYPQYQAQTTAIQNNPYATGAQTAANDSGAAYTAAGNQATAGGTSAYNMGNSLVPYSTQILNTAFDPQNALYDRTAQQLQDQTRASEAARGLATSPIGAQLENSAMSNFNIDWQNNQLNRQTQGATAASGLDTTAANLYGAGTNLSNSGASDINQGGQMPYNNYVNNIANIINSLNQQQTAGQATNSLPQTIIGDLSNYMNLGQTAANNANNASNTAFQNQMTQGQNIGSFLGTAIPTIGNFFSGDGAGAGAVSGAGDWLSSLFGGGAAAGGADAAGAGMDMASIMAMFA